MINPMPSADASARSKFTPCRHSSFPPSPARRLRRFWERGVFWLFFLWLTTSVQGVTAAPANDSCGGAIVIPGAGPFPYLTPTVVDIESATTTSDPPAPGDFYPTRVIRGVWYRFTPAVSASYTLATCGGPGDTATTADTVIAIYTSATGCNGPFVAIGDADDESCSPQSLLTRQLLADTTYYLLVWKFCDGCGEDGLNDVQVRVTATLPPPNDSCANAMPVSLNIPVEGTTVGANDNYQLANTNGFGGINQIPSPAPGRDVVYRFTAPETGDYSFKVTGYDLLQDVMLAIAPSCPAGNASLANVLGAANRSQVSSAEEVLCLRLTAGQQVFALVDDTANGNAGSRFILTVTRCQLEREPNDSPIDAAPLACGVEGSLFRLTDRDFFALGKFPAGWRAFALVDGEAARNANFDLRLTTYGDTVEFDDDNNDISFGAASPNLAGTPLTGTNSFLFVNYHLPQEAEPYRVYAVVQPPAAAAAPEMEPNDSLAEANSAEPNYFRGRLNGASPSTDVDVYAFSVAEGDLIFLSLDCDPHRTNAPINARLELLDASGTPVASVNDTAFSSQGGTNIIPGTLMAMMPSAPGESLVHRSGIEGTFFARVSISPTAAGSSGAGDYLLSISRNCVIGSEGVNHPPTLSELALTAPVYADVPTTLKGTLWELDTGDSATLTITWGDGTTNVVSYDTPGRFDFSVPHTFNTANTNFTIKLAVSDSSTATDTGTVIADVRPLQRARFAAIRVQPNGNILLQLQGSPQADYRVEQYEGSGRWSLLDRRRADAAGLFTVEDKAPTVISKFYRAVSE